MQGDDDGENDHDRRDGVGNDLREVGHDDPIGDPEQESDEQDKEVPDRK